MNDHQASSTSPASDASSDDLLHPEPMVKRGPPREYSDEWLLIMAAKSAETFACVAAVTGYTARDELARLREEGLR